MVLNLGYRGQETCPRWGAATGGLRVWWEVSQVPVPFWHPSPFCDLLMMDPALKEVTVNVPAPGVGLTGPPCSAVHRKSCCRSSCHLPSCQLGPTSFLPWRTGIGPILHIARYCHTWPKFKSPGHSLFPHMDQKFPLVSACSSKAQGLHGV